MDLILPVVAGSSTVLATGAVLYRVIRPRFPAKVNCWFCGRDNVVPFGNQNCWDCPHCDQYNGFTQDGGYNKPIPAQYSEDMNHSVTEDGQPGSEFNSQSQILCVNCNRNQLLKVRQLANFVPYHEANFDEEAESYKRQLDQVYRLCRACEIRVQKVLRRQDVDLQQRLMELNRPPRHYQSDQSAGSDMDNSMCTSHIQCCLSTPWHVGTLRFTSLLCALTLLMLNAHQLTEHSQMRLKFEHLLPKGLVWYMELLMESRSFLVLLGVTGTIAAVFTGGKDRLLGVDAVACFLWLGMLVLHSSHIITVLPPSDLYLLQAMVSIATAVFVTWCTVCKRYEKTSRIRIRTRRKRHNLDHSAVSSTSESHDSSAALSLADEDQASSVQGSVAKETPHVRPFQEPVCRDQLESMSLGPPKRSHKPGVFSQPSFNTVSSSTPSKTSPIRNHGNILESLSQRRPIISPARFKATPSTTTPSPSVSSNPFNGGSGQPVFGSSFAGSSRKLFSDAAPQASGSAPQNLFSLLSYASSVASDDRASLFSEARGTQGSDDDSSSQHSQGDSESSECPVDTTCLVAGEMNGTTKKRSFLFRCILGIAIGLAIFLLLFYFFDLRPHFNHLNMLWVAAKDDLSQLVSNQLHQSEDIKVDS